MKYSKIVNRCRWHELYGFDNLDSDHFLWNNISNEVVLFVIGDNNIKNIILDIFEVNTCYKDRGGS
jgi:hypothetical protein